MNTGQTLFALGAMALLSTSVVTINRSYTATYQEILHSKLGITAVSLGTSIVEEATGKAFDKNTDDTVVTTTSGLTAVASLGKETGEYYPDSLNDFDDFNNLDITKIVQDSVYTKVNGVNKWVKYGGGTFRIRCKVEYVRPGNPDVAATTQTFNKKLTVTLTSPDMKDTVRTQYVYSYWYF
jgi:hypothetical protein